MASGSGLATALAAIKSHAAAAALAWEEERLTRSFSGVHAGESTSAKPPYMGAAFRSLSPR